MQKNHLCTIGKWVGLIIIVSLVLNSKEEGVVGGGRLAYKWGTCMVLFN